MVFEKVSDMMEVCASKVPPRGRNWRKAHSQQAWRFRRGGLGGGRTGRLQREGCEDGASSLSHPWSCFSDLG